MPTIDTLITTERSLAAVEPNRIIARLGSGTVGHANASAVLIGVSGTVGKPDGDGVVDVMRYGVAEVKLAARVVAGQYVTSNASGEGIPAAPNAGANANVVGIAEATGNTGDIIQVYLAPGRIQG